MYDVGFRDLQNYTTLKLPSVLTALVGCFRDLQNYTTLKQRMVYVTGEYGFRDLQNYTTLKHICIRFYSA